MFVEGQEILDKRYRVVKKLGGGAFGEIYKGKRARAVHFCSRKEKDRRVPCCQSRKFRLLSGLCWSMRYKS